MVVMRNRRAEKPAHHRAPPLPTRCGCRHRAGCRAAADSVDQSRRAFCTMFYSSELLNSKGPMGQIWILANMPQRVNKLTRQKAAGISVIDSCMEIIQPKAPLALRLAAVLMRGVVSLYSRQIFFLHEDAANCLLRLKSHITPGMDKNVLDERRAHGARPEQITREVDPYELMAMLDYATGDDFSGGALFAASQGGDSFVLVDESAMRAVQASELRHGSVNHPAGRGGVRGRRGGTVINLPDDDMLTGDDEEAVSGAGTSLSGGGHRSMYAPDEEEFEALPDDEDAVFGAAPAARVSGGSGREGRSAGSDPERAGALARIGEDEDEFFVPPPLDDDLEVAPMPVDQDEGEPAVAPAAADEAVEEDGEEDGNDAPKRARKPAAKRQKRGILRGSTVKMDDALALDGDVLRAWLSNCDDIFMERPKIGDAPPAGRLGARLDAAMQTPSVILMAAHTDVIVLGKRTRALCEPLVALFARHAKTTARRAAAAAPSPSSSAEDAARSDSLLRGAGGDDPEAFRDAADGSVDGAPALPSPGSSLGAGAGPAAAAGFGRRSGLSGGSGSLLAAALAGVSPKSNSVRTGAGGGRASDAFGGGALRPGDLPGGAGDDFFDGAALPEDEEYDDAAVPADVEYDALGGGGGGSGFGGLGATFESLLETGPTQTQAAGAARDPAATLSGVSAGVAAYFASAFGESQTQTDKALRFSDLCTANSLNRTQKAQLFAQVLVLVSNSYIKAKQAKPYGTIYITKGTATLAVAA